MKIQTPIWFVWWALTHKCAGYNKTQHFTFILIHVIIYVHSEKRCSIFTCVCVCGACEMNCRAVTVMTTTTDTTITISSRKKSHIGSFRFVSTVKWFWFFAVFLLFFAVHVKRNEWKKWRKKEEQNPIDNDADDETGLCSFERIFKLSQKFLFH